ncbi:MAG: ABC transporter substrate-binding protein [Candidatus Tectomicrobia bacterium]|nr:ABC transporter substrate-binding protein [Candidatus Tectomicrobia bacterium]
MKRQMLLIIMVSVVLTAILATVLYVPGATKSKEVVFTRTRSGDPGGLDPQVVGSIGGGLATLFGMYDQLVALKGQTDEIGPALAESWETPDPKTYIFHIRKGVTFHDGTPVNAEAVKFTVDRVIAVGQLPSGYWKPLEKIEVVDDYTVKMTLREPYAPWLATLAGERSGGYIVSPTCVKEHATADDPWAKKWLYDHDCGSGPYMLQEWVHENRIVMVKYPNYWRGWEGKHVDKIVQKIVKEPATVRFMLEKGEIDIGGVPVELLDKIEQNKNITIDVKPSFMVFMFYMNVNKPPTDDVRVRKAIAHALDYDGIIQTIHKGYGRRPRGPLSSKEWPQVEGLYQYTYDLNKAKKLLEEAGWKDTNNDGILDKDGQPLEIKMLINDASEWKKMVLILQDGLKKVGVNLDIQWVTWPVQYSALTKPPAEKPYNMTGSYAFLTVPDPDERFRPRWHSSAASGGYNAAGYMNPKFDALLDEAAKISDRKKREQLYSEAQMILSEDAPGIFVIERDNINVSRSWVKNFIYNPGMQGIIYWYDLYIEGRPDVG